jgi:hypothetical protein
MSQKRLEADERTQFLNGQNDGDLAFAADGAYAGGAALEIQPTAHLYLHAVAVDTEGSADSGLGTPANKKFMESSELGWFSARRDSATGTIVWVSGMTTRRPRAVAPVAALHLSMS